MMQIRKRIDPALVGIPDYTYQYILELEEAIQRLQNPLHRSKQIRVSPLSYGGVHIRR